MRTIRVLILEDDLLTLSKIAQSLNLLEEKLVKQGKDLSIVVLSEYTQVEKYINTDNESAFDIVLLDRDCKAGGSFHVLDVEKIGTKRIIGISSVPDYNDELLRIGINRIVHKDYQQLDRFTSELINQIKAIIAANMGNIDK